MKRYLLAGALLALSALASAQTITLTASPATGVGSVTPTLTWSTTPAATSCSASGGWSGTKAASGSAAVPAINLATDYTLTCTWPGSAGTADVRWLAPTTNTNNTPLTGLAVFRVVYGTSSSALSRSLQVNDPTATVARITGLAPGTWFFAVIAIDAKGNPSTPSAVATKVITGPAPATAAKTVNVNVDTQPNAPTDVTVIEVTAYDIRINESTFVVERGRIVGKCKLGAACDEDRTTGDGYFAVERPSRCTKTRESRSVALVAKCS